MTLNALLPILGAVSALFLMATFLLKHEEEGAKWVLFLGIALPVGFGTLFLVASTVYTNALSVSKGPVHWHADFLVYRCGEKVELPKPKGLSNRIGTPLLHEHGDSRIHIEGHVQNWNDITLGTFFDVIGGTLKTNTLKIPQASTTTLEMTNGERCADGKKAELQVFVYSTQGKNVTQRKLENPAAFLPTHDSAVPPGDCIVVEFAPTKARTEYLCETYRIAEEQGRITIK